MNGQSGAYQFGGKTGTLMASAGDNYLEVLLPEGFEIRVTGDCMLYVYMGDQLVGMYYTDIPRAVLSAAIRRQIGTWQKRGKEGA